MDKIVYKRGRFEIFEHPGGYRAADWSKVIDVTKDKLYFINASNHHYTFSDTKNMEEFLFMNIQKETEFYKKLNDKKYSLNVIEQKWKRLHKK